MENYNIAYCGLYCGACGKFAKGKCPGCSKNEKATWCQIRKCCMEHGYDSCANCTTYSTPKACKKYNNVFAKVIGFVTNTDRSKCIDRIKAIGIEAFAKEMSVAGKMSIRK